MNKKILILSGILILLVFASCEKLFEELEGGENDEYLVTREQVKIISQIEVDAAFAFLSKLYPDAASIGEKAISGLKVYKITYNTEFNGDSVVASGLVCVPIGSGEYPILSFQNGTNTLHENAPSVNPDWELYQFLETVSSTGFVLVIPDFIGFGSTSDSFHPYLDKESTVQCTVDMIRATRELMAKHNLDVKLNGDLYITGYSMGGWATLQLHKALETEFTGEFNLKASVCSAGPYNLHFIMSNIMGRANYPMPYFLGYILQSYINLEYIANDYTDIINEPYASRIPALYDGTLDGETINAQLTTSVADLFTENFRNNYKTASEFSSFRQSLLNNSIEAWNISAPLVLLHGADDDFIAPQVSENMYNEFLSAGVSQSKIQLVVIPGTDHSEGIVPCGVAAINWFLQIRDGE